MINFKCRNLWKIFIDGFLCECCVKFVEAEKLILFYVEFIKKKFFLYNKFFTQFLNIRECLAKYLHSIKTHNCVDLASISSKICIKKKISNTKFLVIHTKIKLFT